MQQASSCRHQPAVPPGNATISPLIEPSQLAPGLPAKAAPNQSEPAPPGLSLNVASAEAGGAVAEAAADKTTQQHTSHNSGGAIKTQLLLMHGRMHSGSRPWLIRCSSWVGGWKSKSVMCPYNILKAAERRASLPVPPETLMQPSGNKRQYPSDAVSAAEPKRQQTAPGIEVCLCLSQMPCELLRL